MATTRIVEHQTTGRPSGTSNLELWGGVECTVNRVGDQYFDQMARSGHADRLDDLDLFASLGLRTLRYPILWERVAPNGLEQADWSWADERLGRLRELGIRPIVGLCHHGSGPRYTDLLDPDFPTKLADFALAVARRYPWVDAYTPVNEPLTTARFSALYGHWYPHRQEERAFIQALLHQCRAVSLAMGQIRQVNPQAQLVQTEDLGKTFSTPELAYQADFDNQRRWLTFDLLSGLVDRHHPLWDHLTSSALDEHLLHQFAAEPCPPDLLGLNYYVTGERFLDHRIERYPPWTHGGNGQHTYADVEAVRVIEDGIAGPTPLLREAWDRYARPIAITEAHLGCTREEQVRWLADIWSSARSLKRDGMDIRAVTVWSLLGAFDWHCLLTRQDDHYEPGVFDVRSPTPRPTALAGAVTDIINNQHADHPLAGSSGWWQRQTRLLYPPVGPTSSAQSRRRSMPRSDRPDPSLLIFGTGDRLEQALADACAARGISYRVLQLESAGAAGQPELEETLRRERAWAAINATTHDRLDVHHPDLEPGGMLDVHGSTNLANACGRLGIRLLTFSSDLVFSGSKHAPYIESDPTAPRNAHGLAHAVIERRVLAAQPDALLVRTSSIFGLDDPRSFIDGVEAALIDHPAGSAHEVTLSLTYAPDLIAACLDFLIDGDWGILHLSNPGAVTWDEIANQFGDMLGKSAVPVVAPWGGHREIGHRMPTRAVLGSERAWVLPPVTDALIRYISTLPTAASR